MKSKLPVALCALIAFASSAVQAYEAGDIVGRVGIHYISPKSDNHDTLDVQSTAGLTASAAYFLHPQWAIDLLVAAPFEHDVELNGSKVASTMHLPPTLSLVWYPQVGERWHPYVGVGVNYTVFFNQETTGPIQGQDLDLDPSFGVAALAGVDWDLSHNWGIAFDVRYMDIDTDGELDGASLGTFEIDPMTIGISASYKF